MIVYELLVNWDGRDARCLRFSRYCSQGLFETKELAEAYRRLLRLESWQNWKIKARKVVNSKEVVTQ